MFTNTLAKNISKPMFMSMVLGIQIETLAVTCLIES